LKELAGYIFDRIRGQKLNRDRARAPRISHAWRGGWVSRWKRYPRNSSGNFPEIRTAKSRMCYFQSYDNSRTIINI